jgi:hypothetical protein
VRLSGVSFPKSGSEGVILMKDRMGKVIGFEKLNYLSATADKKVSFETAVV